MCCLAAFILSLTLLKGIWGLRNVSLLISPSVVERGKNVELLCKYDLQGAPLYSIKYYRGNHEFYRYSPMDVPTVKLFPFPGLQVDLSQSVRPDSNVLLQGADYSLAGNISCEVSTDAPTFSTQVATKCLSVVELPKVSPHIHAELSSHYEAGDSLRATCTSGPARPAPSLSWFINDEPAIAANTRWYQSGLLETRSVSLDTSLLPRHVTSGSLVLKCSAVLAHLYKETASIVLSSAGEPKHDRVRLSEASLSPPPVLSTLVLSLLLTLR